MDNISQNQTQTQTSKTQQDTSIIILTSDYIKSLTNCKIHVICCQITEEISKLSYMDLDFVCEFDNNSEQTFLDTERLISEELTLSIIPKKNVKGNNFIGYASDIKELGNYEQNTNSDSNKKIFIFYHLELRPALWKYTQIIDSKVFVNKNIEEIIKDLIAFNKKDQWLYIPAKFELTSAWSKTKHNFIMQYNENKFDFLCWLLEQNGVYFYFKEKIEQNNNTAELVITDNIYTHASLDDYNDTKNKPLLYSKTKGFNIDEQIITSFVLKQQPTPKTVIVNCYNFRKPNTLFSGSFTFANSGFGQVILTNEEVEDQTDANIIAKIRGEEIYCHSRVFTGTSNIMRMTTGVTFRLQGHFNDSFNYDIVKGNKQEYLITKVVHQGSMMHSLSQKLSIPAGIFAQYCNMENMEKDYYHNSFECIKVDAKHPYRPKRVAPRAKIGGVLSAKITYIETNKEKIKDGNYKIKFPFINDCAESPLIRRAKDQAGFNSGFHVPLIIDTEVLVSFIRDNPNFPIIVGAVENADTSDNETGTNPNVTMFTTPTGQVMSMSDKGITFQTNSGKGFTITDGSNYDATSDTHLQMASLFSNSISGLQSTISSLFKNKTSTMGLAFNKANTITLASVLGIGAIIGLPALLAIPGLKDSVLKLAGLKENPDATGDPSLDIGSMIKGVLSLLGVIGEETTYRPYSHHLTSDANGTVHSQQVLPNSLKEVVAGVVAFLVLNTYQTWTNVISSKQHYKKSQEQGGTSSDPFAKAMIKGGIADLLPNIMSIILLIVRSKFNRSNYDLGGFLLHSADANINLVARDPISLHSARGILNNTEDLKVDEQKLSVSTKIVGASGRKVYEIQTSDDGTNDGHTFAAYKDSSNYKFPKLEDKHAVLHWGKTYQKGKLPGDYENGKNDNWNTGENSLTGFLQTRISDMAELSAVKFQYKYDVSDKFENSAIMKARFIANQTQHIINVAEFGTDLFAGQKYNVAYSFVFSTKPTQLDDVGKGITQLRMHTKDDENALKVDGYQPSKTGFLVDVFGATANEHSITLRAHSGAEASADDSKYKKPSSWLNLSEKLAEVSVVKDDSQKQILKSTDTKILLGVAENKKDISDIKSGAIIEAEKSTMKVENNQILINKADGISISSDNKVTKIESVEFKKTDISNVEKINGNNITISGSVIKIG